MKKGLIALTLLLATLNAFAQTTIYSNNFESGDGGWTDGGSDCHYLSNNSNAPQGSGSWRIRDNNGNDSAFWQDFDFSAYDEVTISFSFKSDDFDDSNDRFEVLIDDSVIQEFRFENGGWNNNGTRYTSTLTLTSSSYNFNTTNEIKFETTEKTKNNEELYVDEIEITGFTCPTNDTNLSPGDIAITGYLLHGHSIDVPFYNDDQANGAFSFVLLTDVSSGEEIIFTDYGVKSDGTTFKSGESNEGSLTWTANTNLASGTEVFIILDHDGGVETNVGTVSSSEEMYLDDDGNGDQILAYQESVCGTNTFLYAVNFGDEGWTNDKNDDSETAYSALPSGLQNNNTALDLYDNNDGDTKKSHAAYNCGTSTGAAATVLAAISNTNNWDYTLANGANNSGNAWFELGTCGFSFQVTTIWNGSAWSNGTPDINADVIISGDYSEAGIDPSFSCKSLTVDAGVTCRVRNTKYIEIETDITVAGNLVVKPYGTIVQNSANGTVTVSGDGKIQNEKITAPSNNYYEYTYWSSPMTSTTYDNTFPDVSTQSRYTFNAANYADGNGDSFDDNYDAWVGVGGSTVWTPGRGYTGYPDPEVFNAGDGTLKFTFEGVFNNGTIDVPVYRNDEYNTDQNSNLLGNPYPSAIDVNAFFTENEYNEGNGKSLDAIVYLWSQNTAPNAGQFSTSDYAYINKGGALAGGDGVTPGSYIPSGQGFFVNFSDSAVPTNGQGTVRFTNSMRSTGNNSQFFRNTTNNDADNDEVLVNKLRLNLTSDNGVFNQILVAYMNEATDLDDGLAYDAPRRLETGAAAYLYSLQNDDATKQYAIQAKNDTSLDLSEVIKIGYTTSIEQATIYSLKLADIVEISDEDSFFYNVPIYIKDNLTGAMHDLKIGPYNFTSESGTYNERFEIVFQADTLGIEDVEANKNALKIIESGNGDVRFLFNGSQTMSSIEIFDVQGRAIYNFRPNKIDVTYNLSNLRQAPFIARIVLDNDVVITKKAIKRY